MSEGGPRFRKGDEVRRQSAWDQVGTIMGDGRLLAGEYWYQVKLDATNRPQLPESDLVPYEGGHDLEGMLQGGRFAGREAFSKLITFTRLRQPLSDNLYSIFASRTEFQPYQFKPLLKFLGSLNGRLLVADEVGLGKTIEAGLIMIEERARHGLDRVLVVCPSSLCEKWRVEMRNRFDEEFSILDAPDIRRFLEDTTQHGEGVRLRGICSIQTLRGRTLRSDWEAAAPPLDLVIVDEAHHLRNPEAQAHQLGRLLSETANAMLLLTATPVHLGNQNLFYLLRTLDPEEYQDLETFNRRLRANLPVVNALRILGQGRPPDLARCLEALRDAERGPEASDFPESVVYQDVVGRLGTMPATDRGKVIELQRDLNRLGLLSHVLTRTRKAEIEVRVKREAHLIRQSLTSLEMQFYQALSRHVFERYAALGADSFAAFAAIMPQRQAASCIPAMVEHYSEELAVKADDSSVELSDLSLEDWVGEEEGDARPEDALPDLRQILKRFAGVDKVDSKFDALLDTLRDLDRKEPGCKVVVFSYFKRTLEYLHRRLSASGFRGVVISGSYPEEERQRRIAELRDAPGTRLLLSSEVGSEGLDFEYCRVVVS